MDDMQPSAEELLQVEEDAANVPALPVVVEGPANVRELPAKSAGCRTFSAPAGTATTPRKAIQVLWADPARKNATVLSVDEPIYFGRSKSEVEGGYAAYWPDLVVLPWGASDELWVASATAATATNVTVIQEQWAEGMPC